ncbi:MAG: cell division protein ZapA [Selenomonas sp.]|nr:cell division protein ZapA [Selenomonas sp.]
MKTAAKMTRSLDTRKIAVLAAMQMASEYADLKKDYDELVQLLEDK